MNAIKNRNVETSKRRNEGVGFQRSSKGVARTLGTSCASCTGGCPFDVSTFRRFDVYARRPAFTITELLVVIGIIVLLAGLLMVAMQKVRSGSLKTATLATMQNFGRACDAFQMDHGQYPGVIPEPVLAAAIAAPNEITLQGGGETTLSSMENALLHLMGGYRVCPPGTAGCGADSSASPATPQAQDFNAYDATYHLIIGSGTNAWHLKININDIGDGPVINGKPHAPYFTPGPREVGVARGQSFNGGTEINLPEVIDAWGQPILYTRRLRTNGPLVGDYDADPRPQFVMEGLRPYLESASLGERGMPQNDPTHGTILLAAGGESADVVHARFAQILRHPSFGSWGNDQSPLSGDNLGRVAPRGAYVLISAGPDGVYFARTDGPGSPGQTQVPNIVDGNDARPQAIASYDDVVIFGGG